MKKPKILLDFIKLKPSEKLFYYRFVIDCLTDNANFPAPYVSIPELIIITDEFEASIIAVLDGGRVFLSIMHDKEMAADSAFRTTAHYVEKNSNGDETKFLSTGFNQTNPPVYKVKAILAVFNGAHSGSVRLVARAVKGAVAYIWQFVKGELLATEDGWQSLHIGIHSNHEADGLEVASYYYYRVAAITANGITEFCDPVVKLVV